MPRVAAWLFPLLLFLSYHPHQAFHHKHHRAFRHRYCYHGGLKASVIQDSTLCPSVRQNTIDPSWSTPNTHLPSYQSLNFSDASRSSSSHVSLTIPVTPVTTDNQQQSWLPTPPSQPPLAPHQNSIVRHDNNSSSSNDNNSLHEDFVLYPPTPASRPQVNLWDEKSPASLSASPNSPANFSSLVNRRHIPHQLSRKQIQARQGNKFHHPYQSSTGFSTSSSYRSSPAAGQKRLAHQRLYANSPRLNRPAVPLFNSTENNQSQLQTTPATKVNTLHRRVMSSSDIISDFTMDFFDVSTATPSLGDLTSPAPSMMQSPVTPVEDYAHMPGYSTAPAPPGTVSPKDLALKDSFPSCPPSSFSTDMATPQSLFESPDGFFSHAISPAFANADSDLALSDNWPPLLNPESYLTEDVETKVSLTGLPKIPNPETVQMTRPAPSPAPSEKFDKRRSKSAGIHKSPPKRAYKDFDGIDPNDPVAMKRLRNTLSARESRKRKNDLIGNLQSKVDGLEAENQRLLEALAKSKEEVPAIQKVSDQHQREAEFYKKQAEFYKQFAPPGVTFTL